MKIAFVRYCLAILVCVSAPISGINDGAASAMGLKEARHLIQAGSPERAIGLLETYIHDHKDSAEAYDLLGFAHISVGQLEAAAMSYDAALIVDPEYLSALEHQGELYLLMSQPKFAERNLMKLERLCRCECNEYELLAERVRDYHRHK